MIHSLLTHFLTIYLGFFTGYFIVESFLKKEINYINSLIIINLILCSLTSSLNDKLKHINKLNEVHKKQLQNRKLFDEIFKLNNIYNQLYKKDN